MLLKCDCNYIIIPVNRNAEKKIVEFYHEDSFVADLEIEIDYINPDHYFYYNIERFTNLTLELRCESEELQCFKKAVAVPRDDLYCEQWRPQFHFSAKAGWLNDPNGLCFYNGTYHMFFQHNPVGCNWGNMHWGHATSADLIHWKETKPALYPDEMGTIYSGSAIVDRHNASGLKHNEFDPILLFYTAAGEKSLQSRDKQFTQCMAYSVDGGVSFEKYTNNPIVDWMEAENRDPKVTYHEESNSYVMAIFLSDNRYVLLSSTNLLAWEVIQNLSLENDAECPDFYPLCVDGDVSRIKWVFSGAADRYILGSFDGRVFTPETESRRLSYGSSYAAQTWSDTKEGEGRRVRIAWNRGEIPDMPFNQCMNFPCEMRLVTHNGEIILTEYPIGEIEQLYVSLRKESDKKLRTNGYLSWSLPQIQNDIMINTAPLGDSKLGLTISGFEIVCNGKTSELICGDISVPISNNEALEVRILIDLTTIEIFINGGRTCISVNNLTDFEDSSFEIEALSGNVDITKVMIAGIGSAW